LGAYKYVWEFFGISSTSDLETLNNAAKIVCSKNWEDFVTYGQK